MATDALVSHRTPERLRIRIPGKKGDAAYFNSLEKACGSIPEVRAARANPLTGSLLLTLEPGSDLSLPDVARKLDLRLQSSGRTTLEQKAADQIGGFNKSLRNFTGGELDLNSIAFLCCLGIGIYQISIGNLVAPAWYVTFWYAMNLAANKGTPTGGKLPLLSEPGPKGDDHGGK